MFDAMPNHPVSQLKRNWLFSAEPPEEAEAVLRFSNIRRLESGQTLFWQDDPVSHVFVVLDGSLKLNRRDRQERRRIMRVAGAPDLVALHCIFSENGYSTTAVAMQDCDVLAINAERFLWHVKQKPELSWRIALHLSREVEDMVGEIEQLSMSSAMERLAAYLLRLHEEPERNNGERVPRRRADLASLLSVSTETLCREISKLRSRGWIDADREGFTVREPERLRELIERKADG